QRLPMRLMQQSPSWALPRSAVEKETQDYGCLSDQLRLAIEDELSQDGANRPPKECRQLVGELGVEQAGGHAPVDAVGECAAELLPGTLRAADHVDGLAARAAERAVGEEERIEAAVRVDIGEHALDATAEAAGNVGRIAVLRLEAREQLGGPLLHEGRE